MSYTAPATQTFYQWRDLMLQAAGVTPFVRVSRSHVQRFCDLCLEHAVPVWRKNLLVPYGGLVYQRLEGEDGLGMPFELWESGAVHHGQWTELATSAPEAYMSTCLHRMDESIDGGTASKALVEDSEQARRYTSVPSTVVRMRRPFDQWMGELASKDRYHVKKGLSLKVNVEWKTRLVNDEIEAWLGHTCRAHADDPIHAQALLLWSLARQPEIVDIWNSDFRALACFVPDGDTLVFASTVRTAQVNNSGQRLLTEAVRRWGSAFSLLDVTERSYFVGEEPYSVYKRSVCNATIIKYGVTALPTMPVSEDPEQAITPPFYLQNEQRWVTQADEVC